MGSQQVAVVGAGIGGLATAARLASRGYNVDVYERLGRCGGRAHIIEDQGFKFDTGPSFVLMPDFYREVFSFCGERMEDYLDLKALEINYKIFLPDGRSLAVYNDCQRTIEDFSEFEDNCAQKYADFIKATEKYYLAVKPLLYKCFTPSALFNPSYWPLLLKLAPFKTYWQVAKKYFDSDIICYILTFEAMFIGVSPFDAPAFYSIITYTDHIQKIFHPMGGMYTVPLALEKVAKKHGARFHYDTEVQKVQSNGRVQLSLSDKILEADQAVINADYAYTQKYLLERKLPRYQYSCSVFLLYLGLKEKVSGLEHHNIVFSSELEKNLQEIFKENAIPQDPSFYVHVPTVTDPSLAPEGKEILYVLIPVPNLDNFKGDFREQEESLRANAMGRIEKIVGQPIEPLIEVEHRFYPEDFINRYNILYGATFGLGHTLWQSAFFRPANYQRKTKNIYYVGASTQPGGGMPPVMASSRIVTDFIIKED